MNDSSVLKKIFCLFAEIACTFCLDTQFFILCCVTALQQNIFPFIIAVPLFCFF